MKLLWLVLSLSLLSLSHAADLPDRIVFEPGALNRVELKGSPPYYVYGAPDGADGFHLLTHVRRDIAGIAQGQPALLPEPLLPLAADPATHWMNWWEERSNYYGQQVTKLPLTNLAGWTTVSDGDTIPWGDHTIQVVAIPGYTTDMVAYLVELEGQRILFTGDLLLKGGKVPDIYSFQDKIPEAKVGAYHGYGARFAPWIESLRKVAALKLDILVPLRGELITDPQGDIDNAISRVQALYHNYLSTNALHWYFGEERLTICGERVLGEGAEISLMPFAEHIDLPTWCQHIRTTKLLVSEDQHGFALDVGGQKSLDELRQILKDGLIKQLDGIWVTHVHNDHSAFVRDAAAEFGCPVYAVKEVADPLLYPGRWFLPGLSPNAVPEVQVMKNGEKLKWKEFTLTADFFPGQMYNHGALLVEKPGHEPVYFIGDSFSPSGIDDYCLMNRNLMRDDTGYFLCLRKVRELPKGSWLVNQHIPHLFRFTEAELDFLESQYRERQGILSELIAWDDPNYGIDEQWAWLYPYGAELQPGASQSFALRIYNHSQFKRSYTLTLKLPEGVQGEAKVETTIPARGYGEVKFELKLSEGIAPGVHVLTASIESPQKPAMQLEQWCEALIKVAD